MGLDVKCGSFVTPGVTGLFSITTLTFQPKFVYFFGTGYAALNINQSFIGAASSNTHQFAENMACYDGNVLVSRYISTTDCISYSFNDSLNPTPAIAIKANFISFNSNGFTVNFTVTGTTVTYFWIAIGGTDFEAYVGYADTNTVTGNQSITGVPFRPTAVSCITGCIPGEDGIGANYAGIGMGFSTATGGFHVSTTVDGLTTPINASTAMLNKLWSYTLAGEATFGEADLFSLDANGFTWNITLAPVIPLRIPYIAWGGTAQYNTGTFLTLVGTLTVGYPTVGFQPSVVFFISDGLAASSTPMPNAGFMQGVGIDSSNMGATWAGALDNAASSGNPYAIRQDPTDCILITSPDNNAVVRHEASYVGSITAGFTLKWWTASSPQKLIGYFAIGPAPSGVVTERVNFSWF